MTSHRSLARAPVANVLLALAVLAAIAAVFANHRLSRETLERTSVWREQVALIRGDAGLGRLAAEKRAAGLEGANLDRPLNAALRACEEFVDGATDRLRPNATALCRQVQLLRATPRDDEVFGQLLRERDLTVDAIDDQRHADERWLLRLELLLGALLLALFAGGRVCAAPRSRRAGRAQQAARDRAATRARDGIVTADADGIITYANPAANQISGIGQLVGRQIGRRVSTDAIAQTLRDGETRHVEQELIAREDGVEQIVEYAVTGLKTGRSRHRPRIGLSRHLRPRPG